MIGIMALLISILLPPLQYAHRQAKQTRCAAQLRELGVALTNVKSEYKYYPIWDDLGSPSRYTWVDVLLQRRQIPRYELGICPEDPRPGELNGARGAHFNVSMRLKPGRAGIDYSYGISVPLAAGGWNWMLAYNEDGDTRDRTFLNADQHDAQRVLAADAGWSFVYNLSADATLGHGWSYPTQFDNTVDWRHPERGANAVMQDGHVEQMHYNLIAREPINTSKTCVWFPGEDTHVGPYDHDPRGFYYPNATAVYIDTGVPKSGIGYPTETVPGWYSTNMQWTISE